MTNELRQAPDKWGCKLPDRDNKANGEINVKPGIEVFIDALATIGYQPDRRGSDQPQDVDEATAQRSILSYDGCRLVTRRDNYNDRQY